mmetsp:Transcript_157832/g.506221  ORF Transcript_157832/g.506221 Transcript_157832/m.506221 type:complete len:633 (+) Transcript_157832:84-1982(+)
MARNFSMRRSRGLAVAGVLVLATASQLVLSFVGSIGRISAPVSGRRSAPGFGLTARFAVATEVDYDVGDKVKAKSPEDEKWYPAKIDADNGDGTFVVRWDDPDDGDETNILGPDNLKKFIIYKDYKVGDDCRGISPDDEKWYPGVVSKINKDGTFQVKWDDGEEGAETNDVDPEFMRRQVIFKNYKKGDKVEAKYPEDGNMYAGTVIKLNKDGTFQVKWEDSDGGPEDSPIYYKNIRFPPVPVDSLKVGQKYKGTVMTIRDFGAFVDFNCAQQGMVHISQITEERVDNVADHLEEGQEVDVWISRLRDDGKIALTMVESKIGKGGSRIPMPQSWEPFQAFVDSGGWVDAQVAKVMPFGAFVVVTLPGGEVALALVHVSQLQDGFCDNPEDVVEIGQEIKVRIISVDEDRNKISCSMKESGGDGGRSRGSSREQVNLSPFDDLESSQWLTGKVVNTQSFGAFVEVPVPGSDAVAQGLVHVTQIKEGFVENVADELEVGQEVQVRVTGVDVGAGKLSLSMKPEESGGDGGRSRGSSREQVDLSPFDDLESSQWLTGKVVNTQSFGAFVEVPVPGSDAVAQGLVHVTQIKEGFVENVADELEVGQEVQVRVTGVDVGAGKLSLSMKPEDGGSNDE